MRLNKYILFWLAHPYLIGSFIVLFSSSVSSGAELTTTQKLRSLQVPELQFRQVPLEAILERVRAETVKSDPEGVGVNIVALLDAKLLERPLTLSVRAGSVGRALTLICAPLPVYLEVDDHAVLIKPRSAPDQPE